MSRDVLDRWIVEKPQVGSDPFLFTTKVQMHSNAEKADSYKT